MSDATTFEPGSIGWLKARVQEISGLQAERFSAPGGVGRASVRVHLSDGTTAIATRRDTPARTETEAGLLQVLSAEGASVPNVLGYRDGLLLQEDLGRNRLSYAVAGASDADRPALLRAALTALQGCRAAIARRPEVAARLPGLGTRSGWAEDFVSRPFFLSGDLSIAMPAVDADALAQSLAADPVTFTRWDARLANATLRADGTVAWFDWAVAGLRGGVEDLGAALADDYCDLAPATTLGLLGEVLPDDAARGLALRTGVLVAANRLARIQRRIERDGWIDAEEALRLDRMTAVPAVVAALTARMSALATEDALTAGLAPWFAAVGDALLARADHAA
ncbi:hypothetical protein [Jannaschia marina]|uniref:hypothetical protein n=1 Tax=Jannaschia marina TaxID=2741674 RepID=UPI0015C87FFC|nr:hypothetical protein [Jannaschia marina]